MVNKIAEAARLIYNDDLVDYSNDIDNLVLELYGLKAEYLYIYS